MNQNSSYRLLDSGDFQKLEIIGGYKLIRPSLNSPYKKSNPELWNKPDGEYIKNDRGSGEWNFYKRIPESFIIELDELKFKSKLTPFGHVGFFPEQRHNWNLISNLKCENNFEVLNLFAYSGISTLACLKKGFPVCHVDSSKGMVEWARENSELSGLLGKKVRWIVDDVLKFLKREIKRGRKYGGFILDPPTFGRGANGEVWKIEEHLIPLLEMMLNLCDFKPEFIMLSCHSTGFSSLILERILKSFIKENGKFSSKELSILEESGNLLSGGFCSYYFSKNIELP